MGACADPAHAAVQAGLSQGSDERVEAELAAANSGHHPAGRRSAIASVIASTATSMAERTTVAHDPFDAGILDRAQVELASRARAFRLNASEPLVDQVVTGRWTRFAAGARDRGRHARTDPGLTAARTTQGPVLRALANRRG